MRHPYRRLSKFERRIRAFRLWLLAGTDEQVIGACLLFLIVAEIWWILL